MDRTPWTPPSFFSVLVFLACCAVVVGVFIRVARAAGARRPVAWGGVAAWLALTGLAGGSGLLAPGPTPPPLMIFFVVVQGTAIGLAVSGFGRRVAETATLGTLIGVQAFRLPLELVLHRWYVEGVIPVQMTYDGWNYDIISGVICAIAGAWLALRPPVGWSVALAWVANVVGFGLLLAVMTIAVTSAPGPLFRFTDDLPLMLPLHFPTVWIVSVCVAGALFFHLVAFRALLRRRSDPAPIG